MKLQVTISEITHEDLVNLLCTATYGSNIFSCHFKKSSYYGTDIEKDEDVREDKWASVLLSGKPVYVYDHEAEDEDDFYGNLPHNWKEDDECMRYEVTLDDIKKGIEKAIENGGYARQAAIDLIEEAGNLDIDGAECLLQKIVFGEVIYG